MRRLFRCAAGALLLVTVYRTHILAATLPTGFAESPVASGLSNPTAMAFAPDGRLFVCLQGGQVRVIENGTLLATPFVSITVDGSGERGLLGLAFDPSFATNHYVYIYYTATTPSTHNRVSRFVANGNVAIAGSETVILDLDNLSSATNHNGGAMHFGIDGRLYIGVGENATRANAQSLNNLLGKILRINADGTIPTDNPFYAQATGRNRAIWALGLRNPYTFAVQPLSGRMLIDDVGENSYEEINDGFAGFNYGWPDSEGPTTNPNHTGPIYYYPHGGGPIVGCAITGGAFYNPDNMQFPASFLGKYFFADFCSGWIKVLDSGNSTVADFASGISNPVDLQVGPNGHLYYLARGAGSIFRIQYTGNQAPQITQQPASQTVAAGQPVTFTVGASGSPAPAFKWQRNGVDIPGATSVNYTIASVSAADTGARFRAIATNPAGSATSAEAILTVTSSGRVNAAAAANGAAAFASSTYNSGYAASGAINGDRKGAPWGNGGGWNDATPNGFPDWLEVDFAGARTIEEVDVFSVQDNYQAPVEPASGQTFNFYGLTDFQVQYWTGAAWATVPGGTVSGNTLVWSRVTFAPLTTTRIRILITGALNTWSRVTEIEAY
jgi:glucose/arabinose dehydrogenase